MKHRDKVMSVLFFLRERISNVGITVYLFSRALIECLSDSESPIT